MAEFLAVEKDHRVGLNPLILSYFRPNTYFRGNPVGIELVKMQACSTPVLRHSRMDLSGRARLNMMVVIRYSASVFSYETLLLTSRR